MKGRIDIPRNNFTPAVEAISNLLLPELDAIFSGGWSAALAAHAEITIRPANQRSSPFYRYYLPLQNDLVVTVAASYRRYFKLALAHPRQAGHEAHRWAWDQLQPFVAMAVEWIRSWYILACDGENQFVRRVASTEFVPGQTVSVPIATPGVPHPPPESWRAPAWLFAISPHVGIGPLKTEHVPAKDSEQRLGAAHTRLLLKGARRVFLWAVGAAIETVRNEEIAAAGAIPSATIVVEQAKNSGKGEDSERMPRGTEGLGQKAADYSRYMDGLTDRQKLAFSLRLEYRLPLADVASRMGVDRKTAYEHLQAALRKIDQGRSNEKRKANRAKHTPEE